MTEDEQKRIAAATRVREAAAQIEDLLLDITQAVADVHHVDVSDIRMCVAEAMPRAAMIKTLAPKLAAGLVVTVV